MYAYRVCEDEPVTGMEGFDVVIVSRDHEATLTACLTAVESLEPSPRQVVVVDNGSHDGSADRVRRFRDRLPLELVQLRNNTGFAAGFNTALGRCSAPWVLSLNPDAAPARSFVAELWRGLEATASQAVGSATGHLVRADGPDLEPTSVLDAAGMIVLPSGRHLDRGAGEPDCGAYDEPAWVFGGTGAATLFRRVALDDVAYPNGEVMAASLFAYREDAELAWRLQWRGWRCLYVPTAVAAHLRGFRPETGRSGHTEINRLSVRNRFLLRVHCADLWWHVGCFPWWLLRDVVVAAACATVERSSLPGLLDVVRLRHDAARRRRWVLGRATAPSRAVRRWFRRGGLVEPVEGP